MDARDLFLSHSSDDVEVARELRTMLEAAGYSCWMAPDNIVGTDTSTEQILGAILASRAMLVLVSSNSIGSTNVASEVSLGTGPNRAVIPFRIEDVKITGSLEDHLEGLKRIDAFPPPIANHRKRILRRLGRIVPLGTLAAAQPTGAAAEASDAELADRDLLRVGAARSTSAPPASRSGPRWRPASGLSAALVAIVTLVVVATGVVVLRPGSVVPTGSPSSTLAAVANPSPSQPPASIESAPAASTVPSPAASDPSPPAAETSGAEPTRQPDPPATPKVTRKPAPTPTSAIDPARMVSHSNRATVHGSNVVFSWTAASGVRSVRSYSVHVGSTPPSDPCNSGWCREPGDDAYSPQDIDARSGIDPDTTSWQAGNMPMDGSTIYVRLFTKYDPESGVLAWRDYTFTSAP
jgi:cell division septation protein DedD